MSSQALRFLVDATVLQYPFSGIAKATLGLYSACRDLDPATQVVLVHRTALSIPAPFPTISVRLPFPVVDGRWRALALPLAARSIASDVIHFPWNGKIPRFLPSRTPVVSSLMDVLPLDIPGHFQNAHDEERYRKGIQADIDRADLVITISEFSRRRIVEEFRVRSEPRVIHLGVFLPDAADDGVPQPSPTLDEPFFLFSGGFDPRKRVELAIAAVCELWQTHALRIPLVVVGKVQLYSAELERIFRIGTEMGAVKSAGYVSDSILRQHYGRALGMIYPSRFEGFGLPPLEAMALGCPVITCKETSIPEVCGDAAMYLDPAREKESLVEALRLIATNPRHRQDLIVAGRAQADRFSWRRAAETYFSALEPIVRKRSSGSTTP